MAEIKNTGGVPVTEFKVGSSSFLMAPAHGFRLMQWNLSTAMGVREVLHWPGQSEGVDFACVRGGNPLLFPFSGRSFDRGLVNTWRAPSGEQLAMPQHGFARKGEFRVTRQTDNDIEAVLVPDEEAQAAYPYEYAFAVAYRFEELSLKVTLTLFNQDQNPIPWSAGHHFYFRLPWHEGARRADYRLNLDARKCAYHGPDGKLVMERDRNTCHDLSDPALLDRIHWQLRHNRVSFGPKGGEEDIHIVIGDQEVPMKNTCIVSWSESEDAPYYCIEPWMGPPNAAEHGKGLHWVAPGESESFSVEISLF
ncbi:MAG: aldose epimerase [Opitutales bacterium]|jgi:galactose mutarotase-like enzyme